MAMNARTVPTAIVGFTPVLSKRQEYREPSRAVREAVVVFVVLVTVTTSAVWFLYALGWFRVWDLAVTIFTVLVLAAGTIYTVFWFTQPRGLGGR